MDIPEVPYSTLIISFAIAILMSAFFSGAKSSYFAFSKTKLKTLANDGKKSAKAVLELSENGDSLKTVLHLGNFLANMCASVFLVLIFLKALTINGFGRALLYSFICIFILLLFGEITPSILCSDWSEKFVMIFALPLQFFFIAFYPLSFIFKCWTSLLRLIFRPHSKEQMTEEELITIVEEAQNEGGIDGHESKLICSAIEFYDLEVASILTPRVDIISIEENTPLLEIAEVFRTSGFSRLPVYRNKIDNIIGIIHEKDFNSAIYEGETSLKSVIHEVVFITESIKISKVLKIFQDSKVHMAIVADEFGGTSGLVTLEDVLEGLVGDIWDEHDEVINDITKIDENVYLVFCDAPFDILCEKCDVLNGEEQKTTVGAWVIENLSKIPEVGDNFKYENLYVEVSKTYGRRAIEIKLKVDVSSDENFDEEKETKNDNNNKK